MSQNGKLLQEMLRRYGKTVTIPPSAEPFSTTPRPNNTPHGLEIITPADIARLILPDESSNNATLLDAAAGHVVLFGTPPNEYVCITNGLLLRNGVWSYESGVTVAGVMRVEPGGLVNFFRVGPGDPNNGANWHLTWQIDANGNLTLEGGLTVVGAFNPGVVGGTGPNGTILMKRSLARMSLSYDVSTGPTFWQMIDFDTVEFDTGGFATHGGIGTPGGSYFVVPRPGYYTLKATMSITGGPGAEAGIRFGVSDKGFSAGSAGIISQAVPFALTTTTTIHCGTSDACWVQYNCDNSATIRGSGFGWTYFDIVYEGE
jgi:hypothetical protein